MSDLRAHPEFETLAVFIEGKLSGSELATVTTHLSECDECRTVVTEAARFESEEKPAVKMKSTVRWWLAAGAAAAIIAAVTLLPSFRDPLARLQPVSTRNYEGRVTAFSYAPYSPKRGEAKAETDYGRMAAASLLEERAEKNASARNLQRFALAQLALGHVESSVDLLLRASKLEPENAKILSDLSAAQHAAGKNAEAAENAKQALRLNPALAEAAFNRALALESLSNPSAAVAAWNDYLRLDSDSRWAVDARRHLGRLDRPRANWDRDKRLLNRSMARHA